MFVEVAAVADLEEAKPLVVKAGGRQVVLVRWRDEVFALRDICPHQTQSFTQGIVRSQFRSSAPGEIEADDACAVLICPQHRWQFELKTGNCLMEGSYRVRCYETKIEGDRILVDLEHSKAKKTKAAA